MGRWSMHCWIRGSFLRSSNGVVFLMVAQAVVSLPNPPTPPLGISTKANIFLIRIFESVTSTASAGRLVPVRSVISTWAPTSSPAKRLPSSLSLSRPSTPSSNMKLVSTSPLPAVSAFPSFAGSVPSAITMPWSLTFSDPVSRIFSTSVTESFP